MPFRRPVRAAGVLLLLLAAACTAVPNTPSTLKGGPPYGENRRAHEDNDRGR